LSNPAIVEREVLVVGVGMTRFVGFRADAGIRDMVAEAARNVLLDAGSPLGAIDLGVAAYESDHFNRQMSLGHVLGETVGLTGKPTVRVEGGGATGALAIQTAVTAIRAGSAQSVLVFGGETNGRSVDRATATEILALSADFEWETPLFGTFAAPYALMITEHMRRYGTKVEQFAEIAVKNRRIALDNLDAHKGMAITVGEVRGSAPLADPYRLFDASLLSDGLDGGHAPRQSHAFEPAYASRLPAARQRDGLVGLVLPPFVAVRGGLEPEPRP